MRLTGRQKWLRAIAWLRREFPTRYPIAIHSVPIKREANERDACDGDTDFIRGSFIIRINSRKWFNTRMDTILHEWAHAITWFGAGHYEEHPDEWGLAYAKIYRAWDAWDYGRKE